MNASFLIVFSLRSKHYTPYPLTCPRRKILRVQIWQTVRLQFHAYCHQKQHPIRMQRIVMCAVVFCCWEVPVAVSHIFKTKNGINMDLCCKEKCQKS